MTSVRWTNKNLERLYQHYMDETGIHDFEPKAIARWANERGYKMPPALTGEDLLARMLSAAALAARRRDNRSSILYRAALTYTKKIKGEFRRFWFDVDGPSATFEKVMASYRSRRDKALNILVSAAASVEHWLNEHPKQKPDQITLDLGIPHDEVIWRLRGPRGSGEDDASGTVSKTG